MTVIDLKSALSHVGIRPSRVAAAQDVHNIIDFTVETDEAIKIANLKGMNEIERAMFLVQDIFGVTPAFRDYDEALHVTQYMVDLALAHEELGSEADDLLEQARAKYEQFRNTPKNKWMFIKPEGTYAAPVITEKKEIAGVEQTVAINGKGEFKKGEKQRLAEQIYQEWMKTAKDLTNNQEVIELFISELGMSRSGATTYNYNMKKKFNSTNITAKPKRA